MVVLLQINFAGSYKVNTSYGHDSKFDILAACRSLHLYMIKKFTHAIVTTKRAIIQAAEQKLGRALTLREREGVEAIHSLTLLEGCHQAFTSVLFTPAQVLADLDYLMRSAANAPNHFALAE
jgi:hypothetical protein